MGSAAAKDPVLARRLADGINHMGWAVSGEDAYAMLRGLRTLPVRMARHGASGLTVAAWLRDQPEVAQVLHPALPGAPDHDLWARDFSGACGLFSLVMRPAPDAAVDAFLDALDLFGLGFSWGGFESLAISCDPQLAVRGSTRLRRPPRPPPCGSRGAGGSDRRPAHRARRLLGDGVRRGNMDAWLTGFLAQEALPERFRTTFEEICRPLGDRAIEWRTDFGRTAFIGLCGAQGSGKSTIAAATVGYLQSQGLRAAQMSLDDFYLGREARGWLMGQVHRLLQVRGPPGTHDVALACAVLDSLRGDGETLIPAFDKSVDERAPRSRWPRIEGPMDVVILEGWCVGARPEPAERLLAPLNRLERQDDPTGAWRGYVNRQLAEGYQALWSRLDRLILLQAPGFEVVAAGAPSRSQAEGPHRRGHERRRGGPLHPATSASPAGFWKRCRPRRLAHPLRSDRSPVPQP